MMTGHEGYLCLGGATININTWSAKFQEQMAETRRQSNGFLADAVEMTVCYVPILQGRPILWWFNMLAETPRG